MDGCCLVWGARSNCILGGRIEWLFNPARRHDGRWETSSTQIVHLAIIQAWYTSSSRVLLVSNLRRSNWKCTVKRFFKSTVMRLCRRARGDYEIPWISIFMINRITDVCIMFWWRGFSCAWWLGTWKLIGFSFNFDFDGLKWESLSVSQSNEWKEFLHENLADSSWQLAAYIVL